MKIIGIPLEDIQMFLDDHLLTILRVLIALTLLILLLIFIKESFFHFKAFKDIEGNREKDSLWYSAKVIWRTSNKLRVSIIVVSITCIYLFGYFVTTSRTVISEEDNNLDVLVFEKKDDGKYYFKAFKTYYPYSYESIEGELTVSTYLLYYSSSMTKGIELTDNNVYLDDGQRFKVVQSDKADLNKLCYEDKKNESDPKAIKCFDLTSKENTIELTYITQDYEIVETTNYLFGLIQIDNEIDEGHNYGYEIYIPKAK